MPGRRAFLRSLGGVVAGLGLGGCIPEDHGARDGDAGGGSDALPAADRVHILDRPLIREAGVDRIWIASPPDRRPAAYVAMATRQVFVDRAHRDRASWLLDAHISVSTGLWRIPLPGDSPLTPISPGDERREFEEMDIGAWDPAALPHEGDIRIVLGGRAPVVLAAGCLPIQGTGDWLAVERIEHERCLPGAGDAVREDFRRLGGGRRYSDRSCTDGGVDVSVLGWACRT